MQLKLKGGVAYESTVWGRKSDSLLTKKKNRKENSRKKSTAKPFEKVLFAMFLCLFFRHVAVECKTLDFREQFGIRYGVGGAMSSVGIVVACISMHVAGGNQLKFPGKCTRHK